MYATQWYQYIYTIYIYIYLSYQPARLSSWTNLKLINSPASAGEELLMPGAILLVPGCRSAADLFLEPGGYEFGGETPGFVKIRFGNLANLEDFDRQVGIEHNLWCYPSNFEGSKKNRDGAISSTAVETHIFNKRLSCNCVNWWGRNSTFKLERSCKK